MEAGGTSPERARIGDRLDKIASILSSGPDGLSTAEAARRLAAYGPNTLAAKAASPVREVLLSLVGNPLVLILLGAAGVSIGLGDRAGGAIIVAIVTVSAAVNVVQARRSQTAMDKLQSQIAPTATALRDGTWQEVPRSSVVPGDVVRVNAGDLVPADARLLTANDLHVRESSLTGESLPVLKQDDPGPLASESPSDNTACLFFGTNVMSGEGTALVVRTGKSTEFGAVAERLALRPPQTEFEKGLHRFSILILKTVFLLVGFVFLVGIAAKHDLLESLLFSIALAVGLTPEFLPMITTITLSQGAVRMAKRGVVVKNLASIQNLGSIDILCSDKTGTLTTGDMTLDGVVGPLGGGSGALRWAALNSRLETGIESSLDQAVLAAAGDREPLPEKLGEIPFDFERRRVSVVARLAEGPTLICKGAPEAVLAGCRSMVVDGQERPLDAKGCEAVYGGLGDHGFRVLAVATKAMAEAQAYGKADEDGMVLQGFLSFVDPTLPDALETVQAMEQAGVSVKIISGDNAQVTGHVCDKVGLGASRVVTGDEIEAMSDTALQHVAEECSVFARVSPAQKSRIILALKARSHVVGYMGDGINDAPSLHVADVGVSVAGAVDVARDAADIILMQPGLDVLREGIEQGRMASGNVMKYLLMGTSSNFGNMFSMAGASVLLPFLPMLPTQILLNNFLYDLSQVTIPSDRVDPAFVAKPLRWDVSLIQRFMLVIGPISSLYDFLTFFVLVQVFRAKAPEFHTGWFIESLATQVLVIFVIRTFGSPWKSAPSRALAATAVVIVVLACLLPYTPFAAALGFVPLPAAYFAFLAVATVTYLLLVEVVKRKLFGQYLAPA